MLQRFFFCIPLVSLLVLPQLGFANHSLINQTRSSMGSDVYVTQAIVGEYGPMTKKSPGEGSVGQEQLWQGFGIQNSLGVETSKFVQVGVSHAYTQLKRKGDSLENLSGSRLSLDLRLEFNSTWSLKDSRLSLDLRLEFNSPIVNLELGGGALASSYVYRYRVGEARFAGSGKYYLIGMTRFLTSRVSVFARGQENHENLTRSSGSPDFDQLLGNTRGISFGVNLWL